MESTIIKNMIKYNFSLLILSLLFSIAFALSNIAIGQVGKLLYDNIIFLTSFKELITIGRNFMIANACFIFFYLIKQILSTYIDERTAALLRSDYYNKYLNIQLLEQAKFKDGEIISNISSNIDLIKKIGGTIWIDIISGVLMLIVLLYWMINTNFVLALILIPAPFIFCIAIMFYGTKLYNISQKIHSLSSDLNHQIIQMISGAHTIKLYMLDKFFMSKANKVLFSINETSIQQDILSTKMQSVWYMIIIPYQAIFYVIAGLLYISKGIPTIGTIIVFSNFVAFMINPIISILNSINDISKIIPNIQSIQEIWKIKNEDNIELNFNIAGDIELHKLSFYYNKQNKILNDISLLIPNGKTTMIIGDNGTGKSTLAKLLIGLYSPTEGYISYDGFQLREGNLWRIHEKIAYLEQQPFLFEGTILENLQLGLSNASMEQIIKATKGAQIHEDIERLPNKYDTVLNEKIPLSGGQKQRITLARCFLRNVEIFVLDEPTSSIDFNNSALIYQCIKREYPSKTIIIITHNRDILQYGDNFISLKEGSVLYQGSDKNLALSSITD